MNKKNCVSLLLLAAFVSQQTLPSAAAAIAKKRAAEAAAAKTGGGNGSGTSTRPQPGPQAGPEERVRPGKPDETVRGGGSVAEMARDYSPAEIRGAAEILCENSGVAADKNARARELANKVAARG